MLEGLVRENWPASAAHPPHSFFEKQQCLGPSTGPLVEVHPLDGSCRVVGQRSPSPRVGTAEESIHGLPLQRLLEPPPGAVAEDRAVQGRPMHEYPSQAGSSSPQQLMQRPPDKLPQPLQHHTPMAWSQPPIGTHQPAAGNGGRGKKSFAVDRLELWIVCCATGLGNVGVVSTVRTCGALCAEVRYHGDPALLLDLPPSICLLMLTLQGLHALLAEEGPCSSSLLPGRFIEKWDVPFRYSKAEYGLDASCPISWNDSIIGFIRHFPEVFRIAGDGWGPSGNTGDSKGPTISCVDPPQFRAVATRMRQLMAT